METTLIQQVYEDLQSRGYNANLTDIFKNNIHTQALSVCLEERSMSLAPTLYPETLAELYAPGMDISELSDRVIEFTEKHLQNAPDFESLQDRDFVLSHTTLSVCNADWNAEMLKSIPHERVNGTDLAVYPRVMIGDGSVKPDFSYLDSIGVSADEIMSTAKANSRKDYTVRTMREVMSEMTGFPAEDLPEINMAVISNHNACNGASAVSDPEILHQASKLLGVETIYLIPSSVHEFLAVPSGMAEQNDLSSMISEVNSEHVAIQDQLSDHLYYYDGTALHSARAEAQEWQRSAGRSR